MPLSMLMVLSLVLGALLGMLANLGWYIKIKRQNRYLMRQANRMQKQHNDNDK